MIIKGSLGLWSYWFPSCVPSVPLYVLGFIYESRLYNTASFLLGVFYFLQHIDLVTTFLRAVFQVHLSQSWVLCTQAKGILYDFLGVGSHFWILCFYLVDCFGRMKSINAASVLQEAGHADSRNAPDPNCKLTI